MTDNIIESFRKFDFGKYDMPLITVYKKPTDYKEYYVARLFDLQQPTNILILAKDIKGIRKKIPVTMTKLDRQPNDDPKIVEVYI